MKILLLGYINAKNVTFCYNISYLDHFTIYDFIFVNHTSDETMKKDVCIEWIIKSGAGQKMFKYIPIFQNTECLAGTHVISTIDNINYKVMFFAKLYKEKMTEYHALARFEDYE